MRTFRDLPIKRKLTVVILGTTTASLLLACLAFVAYDRLTFRQSLAEKMVALADVIAVNSTAALAFDVPEDAEQTLHAASANASILAGCLYDAQGEIFVDYERDGKGKMLPPHPAADGVKFTHDRLILFRPVIHKGNRVGTIYIEAGLEEMMARLRSYAAISALVLAGSFFLAFVLSSLQRRIISEPILSLADTAQQISEKQDFSLRVRKQSEDELGILSDSFNRMLSAIEDRDSALTETNQELRQQIDARAEAERQLKLLNEQLEHRVTERTRELQRSNEELEQFAYVASHDLQEPLRMVGSYVQLLERRYKDKLDADANEFIGFAVNGAKRMQSLIQALLSFSRVGTRGINFQPTDCAELLQRVLGDLKLGIKEAQATVTYDELPKVTGDAVQLSQLFQNMIGNAIKFRGEELPRIHIGVERKEDDWEFCVRDNGIGIDPQYFERIFIIFQRLHNREKYAGTGIGLAVCKKIVQRHGGRIWVESGEGTGAAFHFTIPVKPPVRA